ncbi:MAG: serine--tRNA ligase [Bacteroidetes bacterium GWF2_43_63]|nr:MAG: serine--tRNA ligase [Bacteroidetes bacterium GWE2_42_42]OFY56304.1 MAG: serine--tRNA ligase [Bacteroidetes bacterium GWF2_43_63]HBG71984.1 serine--tRNA ligase [Bacteroidales bacterium]HCB61885.1 serine--tRNA ligase [Bacteroidales bacterium]HCY23907.1 serine--tRNA ligase [Bacteroidales bacterium]
MLTIQLIRQETAFVKERLAVKNFKNIALVDEIVALDDSRRKLQLERDDAQNEMNSRSKEIGVAIKEKNSVLAEELKNQTAELKEKIRVVNQQHDDVVTELNAKLVLLPNLPHSSVKSGHSAEDNEIIHSEGIIPDLGADALPHWDLTTKYKLIDFELGVKITGAGFPVYTGLGARFQRALIYYFLTEAIKAGYVEIQPPLMVNEASGYGTGQLPDKDGQMYYANEDNLYLIPTAEVPVTNIYRDVILKEEDLPVKNAAYSACFRREAGSYGKDVRGLNRLHQFDKVEIVQISTPDKSYAILEEMREHVAGLVRGLGLPFRVLRLCGGDISFTAALTYDFEVFSAAQQKWLEVSSVSNFESFQANRMKLRFKDSEGKTQLAHTLNGSALALPRIVAALLENNQTPEGIRVPEVLVSFMGTDIIK